MLIPLRDDQGSRGLTPVTWLLCAVWLGGYAFQVLGEPVDVAAVEEQLVLRRAVWWQHWRELRQAGWDTELQRGAVLALPLLGHPLLHAGFLHVLSNVAALILLGGRLEQRAGSLRVALFCCGAALVGALVDLGVGAREMFGWFGRSAEGDAYTEVGPAVLGGSTVVAATFASYLACYWRSRALVAVPVLFVFPVLAEVRVQVLLIVWLVFQIRPLSRLLEVGVAEPMSFAALLGAALFGLLATSLLRRRS